jgi:dTDP-4-dehydrorhamnose 3,5-epimerase
MRPIITQRKRMEILGHNLPEVKIITPKVFKDHRGFLLESFQSKRYQNMGITLPFVQDNVCRSKYGAIRGLHYQSTHPQGKLAIVLRGKIFDVAVDIRRNSPTFGKWKGAILSDTNHQQLYIPPGFAHGYCTLSETADIYYKITDYHYPEDELGIIWNDLQIGIDWPRLHTPAILSEKDKKNKTIAEIPNEYFPLCKW